MKDPDNLFLKVCILGPGYTLSTGHTATVVLVLAFLIISETSWKTYPARGGDVPVYRVQQRGTHIQESRPFEDLHLRWASAYAG